MASCRTGILRAAAVTAVAALAILPGLSARAESVADFYRDKTLHMVIGYGPGGGYDIYGRLVAQFLGRHIPGNPKIVPINMPGGSSLRAVDYLLNVAPKDGTYFGSVQQALAMTELIAETGKIDPTRLPYIGRVTSNIDVAVALPQSGVRSFADARQREVTFGVDQNGSMSYVYAQLLNTYGAAKLRVIKGYNGSSEISLAMERGEIDVNGSYSLPAIVETHPDWIQKKAAAILFQNALTRSSLIPDAPTLLELVGTGEGRDFAQVVARTAEVGRSILTTPDVPAERLQALRAAFQAMAKDPDFMAATKTRNLMVDTASGEDMDALTRDIMGLSPPMVVRLRKLLQAN
jgi:tripartite-type tricarboxylate transporter receptor subunit TctC